MAERLTVRIDGENRTGPAFARVRSEVGTLERDVERSTGTFARLGGMVRTTASGFATFGLASIGINAATSAVKGLAGALGFGLQLEMEQVRAQLQAFYKDAGQTEAALRLIRQEANQTPFAFREMAAAMASLLPVSKQARVDIMELVRTAEILAASNPFEGLEGASFALREAMTGDFTSIIERFNLSRQTLNQLKAQGVPALEAVRRAMAEMGLDADLVAAKAQTLSGRWSTFMDTVDTLRMRMTDKLFEGAGVALDRISTGINNNLALFERLASFVGEVLGAAFLGLIEVGTTFVTWVSGTLAPAVQAGAIAVWDRLAPAVTAAVGAAQAALGGIAAFITGTLGPAIGSGLVVVWGAISPAVTTAASTIMGALGSVKNWIAENWPGVRDAIAGAFQDPDGVIGQALEAIRSGVEGVKRWIDENWPPLRDTLAKAFEDAKPRIERVFEDVKRRSKDVADEIKRDWSGTGQAITEGVEAAKPGTERGLTDLQYSFGRLRAFVASDVAPAVARAIAGMALSLNPVINQIVGGYTLIKTAGDEMARGVGLAIGDLVASVGRLTRGVTELAEGGFGILTAKFRGAQPAIEDVKLAAEGFWRITTTLNPAVGALAVLAQTAAGHADSLARGIRAAGSAAADSLGPLGDVARALGSIAGKLPGLGDIIEHSPVPLAEGMKKVSAAAGPLIGGLGSLGAVLDVVGRTAQALTSSLPPAARFLSALAPDARAVRIELADLDLAIARLNEELAYVEPYSAHAAAIQADIQTLTAWRGQIQASTAVLEAQTRALEARRTALDGAIEAARRIASDEVLTATFGKEGGGLLTALGAAFSENTAEAGRAAAEALSDWLDAVKEPLGDRFGDVAGFARFAFFQALGAVTPEERAFWMGQLQGLVQDTQTQLSEDLRRAATLSVESFGAAFAEAGAWEDLKDQLGTIGANVIGALERAWKDGGERNIRAAAEAVAQLREVYKDLPDYVRDVLGPEMTSALNDFLANPTQEGLERLKPVIQQITDLQGLIPKNLKELTPQVQAEIRAIVEAYLTGALTVEEAADRIKKANDTIARSAEEARKATEALNLALSQSGALSPRPSMEPGHGMTPGPATDFAWYSAMVHGMATEGGGGIKVSTAAGGMLGRALGADALGAAGRGMGEGAGALYTAQRVDAHFLTLEELLAQILKQLQRNGDGSAALGQQVATLAVGA